MVERVLVKYNDTPVGVAEERGPGEAVHFEYLPEFIETGIELSPIKMPLKPGIYRFRELIRNDDSYAQSFFGLPGLLADPLPEKFGNKLLSTLLAKQGRNADDLTGLERLTYLGRRGMGALEFEPEVGGFNVDDDRAIDIPELVKIAREVLTQQEGVLTTLSNDNMDTLIQVGTSAGGAKAKAVIAWNPDTNEVRAGQGEVAQGFEHWLIKFDDFDNEEHAMSKELGKMEYAYYLMALESNLTMMESRLFEADGLSHFMTRRFDRLDGHKIHTQSFAALAHADRNPPGRYGYEDLFRTAKELGCTQQHLDDLFRRMTFNVVTRNQDDHTKNHSFLMAPNGQWMPSPVFDLCFSYKKGNRFIESHQMSVNARRDGFELSDLVAAAKAADVKRYRDIFDEVVTAARRFPELAEEAGMTESRSDALFQQFRLKLFDGVYKPKGPKI